MKELPKNLFRCALVIGVLAAVFAGCGNPWMKSITAPLYKDKDGDNAGNGLLPPSIPTSIAEVAAWIENAIAEDPLALSDPDHAIPLPLEITGDNFGVYWPALLQTIADKGAYVALDLTDCGMGGVTPIGEFNPDYTNTSPGKSYIVSLVLPDAAESIPAGGSSSSAAFRYFSALGSVSGTTVTSVGDYAFNGCTSLTTVDLQTAQTIGNSAFTGCTSLPTIDLQSAQTIGDLAFWGCSTLETVNLPVALIIGSQAFLYCTSLETVNLPAAENIGNSAFANCNSVTGITLGAISPTTVGTNLFNGTSSGAITIHVPSGSVPAYSSWAATYGPNFSPKTLTIAGDG
jgi:hypothetical protein